MNSRRGFTLIELMVVMIIIGILASIVTIAIFNSRRQAFNTRIMTDVEKLSQAMSSHLIITSNPAPITAKVTSDFPKKVDNAKPSDIKKVNANNNLEDYDTSLNAIFSKYLVIPVRSGATEQKCPEEVHGKATDIAELGYCYLKYPPDTANANTTDWLIYSGLAYPDETGLFYGSVSGQLKILQNARVTQPSLKDVPLY